MVAFWHVKVQITVCTKIQLTEKNLPQDAIPNYQTKCVKLFASNLKSHSSDSLLSNFTNPEYSGRITVKYQLHCLPRPVGELKDSEFGKTWQISSNIGGIQCFGVLVATKLFRYREKMHICRTAERAESNTPARRRRG